ncbi:CopG family transcriptional regulator [Glycomyces buryatensis]|uniref:Ribbon-helix-helix protein, CopG family n=1 Tax=Glycomyces buryatensis TaxID=2570927 RepID=A0A4V4HSY6_9ACTN|nr:CopG family transcriptional regulator [Glycomyces buryatensis]THV43496.1 ribbon-helix-helix protein, CopG family [Glycomyces buryatensis]
MSRKKSTIYLDEAADMRLEAVARKLGASKAELMRRFIDEGLIRTGESDPLPPLPKYRSEQPLTVDEMDEAIYQSMKRRAQKR